VSHRDCTLGGVCLLDQESHGSCRLPEDERCVSNDACDGRLICVDGACANACTSVTECPEDSRCEAGSDGRTRCVRGDTLFDAGVDARIDDAGDAGVDAGDAGADAGTCSGPACDPVIDVALTERAACAMTTSGAVWCWGYSLYLGAPTTERCNDQDCASRPIRVRLDEAGMAERDLSGATSLSGSLQNICAVTEGRVACWGRITAALGTVGDGRRARLVRSDAGGLVTTATEVTVGHETSLARLSDGEVVGWGRPVFGEFGAGVESTTRNTASSAPALVNEAPYALGSWHGCSVVAGEACCWGQDDVGQSSGTPGTLVSMPTAVAGVPDVIAVSPGRSSSCALTEAGDVWCWGYSLLVPDDARDTCVSGADLICPPTRIFRAGLPFVSLARSPASEVGCAIDMNGGLWCWGATGMRGTNNDPVLITGLPPIERAFVGSNATCAVDRTGEVWCWGDNELGQLGRGTVSAEGVSERIPMRVSWD